MFLASIHVHTYKYIRDYLHLTCYYIHTYLQTCRSSGRKPSRGSSSPREAGTAAIDRVVLEGGGGVGEALWLSI